MDAIRASQLRHLAEYVLHPLFMGFLIALILILCLFKHVGDSKSIACGFLMLLVGFLVLSTSFLPRWMSLTLENKYSRVAKVNPEVSWVVVLGGGVSGTSNMPAGDAMSSASLKRFLEGLRIYRELPHAKLILSGGSRKGLQYSDAVRFNELADMFGVPKADRVLEKTSINTADEARFMKHWLKNDKFYLVTSATHMSRAMALFEYQNLHPIAAPCDYTPFLYQKTWGFARLLPSLGNVMHLNAAWHEYLGLLWAKIRSIRA